MKIAILGTKGIPNNYGGYEQFAEYISKKLMDRGHAVTVYNPSFHAYRGANFNGVAIIRKYSPEELIGGAANFVYDFLCLKDALSRDFDIIYEAGYHSVAIAYKLLNVRNIRRPVILTNMDGLEYNRSKWSLFTQRLIRVLERIAVKESPFMISDNLGIQEYYATRFGRDSFFIPYGADPVENFDEQYLRAHAVNKFDFLMLVARFEPENNLETVLDGFVKSGIKKTFLVVGNHTTSYGRFLKKKYPGDLIKFTGGIYNKDELDALRHFAMAYFHGHSVGGTNPSLLEAMACKAFIIAHNNPFNRRVVYDAALYFDNTSDVMELLDKLPALRAAHAHGFIDENTKQIKSMYNWESIVTQHEDLFMKLLRES